MKKIISGLAVLLAFSCVWCLSGSMASAAGRDEALDGIVDEMYHQLVVEGKNEAVACSDAPAYGTEEVLQALLERDDPDNPYDGNVLNVRGPYTAASVWKRSGARSYFYRVQLINGCDIEEADEAVSKAAEEIYGEIGWDATDREKLYAISDYMATHLYYDRIQRNHVEEYNDRVREYNEGKISEMPKREHLPNGIQALTSEDHGTVCTGYALVTCLIAHKMGLDCKVALGERHAYNLIRFDGADRYIEWDSCRPTYGAVTKGYKLMNLLSERTYANGEDRTTYRDVFEIENIPQVAFEAARGRIRGPKDVLNIAVNAFPVTTTIMLDAAFIALVWLAGGVADRRRHRRRMREYDFCLYLDETMPYPEEG